MSIIVNQPSIDIYGISVRTTNALEMSDDGKIGALWQRFQRDIAPNLSPNVPIYGVYFHYESDANGAFNVLVGTSETNSATKHVSLTAGRYRQFSASGEMPEVIIGLWQEIWRYYERNTHESRAFTTDFELYHNDHQVSIYIALADPPSAD